MDLYINCTWTAQYGKTYVAEAIAWSENGNHATIFATGLAADDAYTKLIGALRELKLMPDEASIKGKEQQEDER